MCWADRDRPSTPQKLLLVFMRVSCFFGHLCSVFRLFQYDVRSIFFYLRLIRLDSLRIEFAHGYYRNCGADGDILLGFTLVKLHACVHFRGSFFELLNELRIVGGFLEAGVASFELIEIIRTLPSIGIYRPGELQILLVGGQHN